MKNVAGSAWTGVGSGRPADGLVSARAAVGRIRGGFVVAAGASCSRSGGGCAALGGAASPCVTGGCAWGAADGGIGAGCRRPGPGASLRGAGRAPGRAAGDDVAGGMGPGGPADDSAWRPTEVTGRAGGGSSPTAWLLESWVSGSGGVDPAMRVGVSRLGIAGDRSKRVASRGRTPGIWLRLAAANAPRKSVVIAQLLSNSK